MPFEPCCAKLQASLDVWVPLGFVTTTLMVSLMLAEESKLSRMDTAELWSVYTHGLVAVLSQLVSGRLPVQTPAQMSVVDVGCGHGMLVEAWRAAGVERSYCIEGSAEAKPMWPASLAENLLLISSQKPREPNKVSQMTATIKIGCRMNR